jgi:hypothetical protein
MNAAAWTRHVRADVAMRPCRPTVFARTLGCVRENASVLPPGNFITDATVRPSHG